MVQSRGGSFEIPAMLLKRLSVAKNQRIGGFGVKIIFKMKNEKQ